MNHQLYLIKLYCCIFPNCSREYHSKYTLEKHIKRNHLGIGKPKCEICDREFASSESYQQHKNIHLNIKPFKCDQCEKGFRNKCMLVRHKRNHYFESSYIIIPND